MPQTSAPANPFHDPLRFERRSPPCTILIFGANGDLAMRKLLPALYRLAYERKLPSGFSIVGNSRTAMSHEQFREKMRTSVEKFIENSPFDAALWDDFAKGIFYVAGDLADASCYAALKTQLDEIEKERGTGGNVLFYLSTQPSFYANVVEQLGAAGLAKPPQGAWRRVVIEKPFGHDLKSAQELNRRISAVFAEQDIYRIDHYFGKETVQNVLAFRFGNTMFEPIWNRQYISHVQVTAAESIGVEGRGAYYQEAGALRDMIQNHLLQVMATVSMEAPSHFESDYVRDERAKLLRSIRIMKPEDVDRFAVKGQYGPARIGNEDVPGFRQEKGVDPNAQVDTYAAVTFFIDNWRWAGVPFYVRTGKRLPKRVTDIAIRFRAAPLSLFSPSDETGGSPVAAPNLLIIRIQPDEGISLRFQSKDPSGSGMKLRPVSMDFNYGSSFGTRTPAAYETLLVDALAGDSTLYTRQDMVEASWKAVEPILVRWSEVKADFPNYEAGSWGPKESDEMLARRGHQWRIP